MNNKIFNKVSTLAVDMIAAAESENVEAFEGMYKELQALCTDNQNGPNNHPVQWETLADFTQDPEEAINYYKKALAVAEKIKEHQYSASINFALAERYSEMDNIKTALEHANQAKKLAGNYDDDVLKNEIDELIVFLTEE